MPVTYNRTVWKNHIVKRPRTYTSVNNDDNSRTDTPAPGEIIQQGTPLNEDNLNNIEQGVEDCASAINTLETVKLEELVLSLTIPTSGWSGSSAPYTININASGVKASDTPIIGIVQSGTYATDKQIRDAWSYIARITAASNKLNVTADVIPSIAIPIQVRCVRHG